MKLLIVNSLIGYANAAARKCYQCEKCIEPFDPLSYNVRMQECPNGYDTCLVRFESIVLFVWNIFI